MQEDASRERESVAVVGAGVAGLTAAWLLQRKYRVELFERNPYAGGHTRTVTVEDGPDAGTPVDMGFIVMNHRNYPVLTRVFEQLDTDLGDSDMSFSYRCDATGYTYAGTNVAALFARAGNLLNREHWRMLGDIIRFNRAATQQVEEDTLNGDTLGQYLEKGKFSTAFANHYLLAMGSAIWSAPQHEMLDFPARPFIHFFHNHGLLTLGDRPQWRYVRGGSHTYVRSMLNTFQGSLHTEAAPRSVRREGGGVVLRLKDGAERRFDHVVIGTHADEALALLEDPSGPERELLGAWRYQPNEAILHTEEAVMPGTKKAWASWNFLRPENADAAHPVSVTYHMNRLQRLQTQQEYFVSLNLGSHVPTSRRLTTITFTHPLYTFASLATQDRLANLNGVNSTYYCGSYFGYGFHEDAARSGVQVAEQMGVSL
jgi:predicted NAD/FAD-binding protein